MSTIHITIEVDGPAHDLRVGLVNILTEVMDFQSQGYTISSEVEIPCDAVWNNHSCVWDRHEDNDHLCFCGQQFELR